MPSSIWSGYLTFGMISIPVKMFPAARSEGIGFNMLHKDCGSRVKQQYICPVHERPVTRDEIVKGYEFEKNRYIEIDPADIKKIEPATAKAMEIQEFVPSTEVDPLFYDTSYYLVPDEPGLRAYVLLRQALEESGKVAIAQISMHNREYTVIVRPLKKGIAIHSMFFHNEVRAIEDMGGVNSMEVKDKELKLAHSLIESLTDKFDPEKYKDNFQVNMQKMLDARLEGREVEEVHKPRLAPVIDLMAALKKSLEEAKKLPRKPAAAAPEAEAAPEVRARKASSRRRNS